MFLKVLRSRGVTSFCVSDLKLGKERLGGYLVGQDKVDLLPLAFAYVAFIYIFIHLYSTFGHGRQRNHCKNTREYNGSSGGRNLLGLEGHANFVWFLVLTHFS